VAARDLRRRGAAEEREPELDLAAEDLEHRAHPLLAADREARGDRPGDERRTRAERQGLQVAA